MSMIAKQKPKVEILSQHNYEDYAIVTYRTCTVHIHHMIMLHVRILSLLCCCAALLWLGTCRLAPPTSCSSPPIPVVIWLAGGSSKSLDCSGGVAVTCSNASWSENWVRRSLTPCARESSGSSDLSRFTAAKTKLMVYSKKCDIQYLLGIRKLQATKVGPLFIFGIISLKLVNSLYDLIKRFHA